jgi:hypothetical protein
LVFFNHLYSSLSSLFLCLYVLALNFDYFSIENFKSQSLLALFDLVNANTAANICILDAGSLPFNFSICFYLYLLFFIIYFFFFNYFCRLYGNIIHTNASWNSFCTSNGGDTSNYYKGKLRIFLFFFKLQMILKMVNIVVHLHLLYEGEYFFLTWVSYFLFFILILVSKLLRSASK